MTTETKHIHTDVETLDAWVELWEFAQSQISWSSGEIDFDRFFERGEKLFNVSKKIGNTT